jgi:hypothetical protein
MLKGLAETEGGVHNDNDGAAVQAAASSSRRQQWAKTQATVRFHPLILIC